MKIPTRPLFVLSANADVIAACNEAADIAGNAVADVIVCDDFAKLIRVVNHHYRAKTEVSGSG